MHSAAIGPFTEFARLRVVDGLNRLVGRVLPAAALLALFCGVLPASAPAQEYSIGEGDLLKITVYDNPDLATGARVSGEGKITFPLIGDVEVNGLTAAEVQQRIADKLREGYIKRPEVAVFIAEYRSKRVTTLGEFQKPGLIELRGNATLMEVISTAGGVTTNAGDELVIKRKVLKPGVAQPEDVTITVPLAAFLEGKNTGEQIKVADGDSIYVPRVSLAHVSALGEFQKPGLIELRGVATLMEVISNAGGVTANAGDELVIKRKVLKSGATEPEDVSITMPLADLLEGRITGAPVMVADGDSVYVPRAAFAYVSGAVKSPGVYKITQGLTVLKAITLSGGFTQRAAKGKVTVIRKSGSGETSIPVRMDEPVLPDDVVVVPESLF